MKFKVTFVAICPSYWDVERVKNWISRILHSKQEIESISVSEVKENK